VGSSYGIDIQVNPQGAVSGSRTAKRSLQEIEQAADKAQGSVSGVAGELAGMAIEAAAGVAPVAALAAAVRTSIQANRQFEKSLSDLSAITGATGDQLAYLKAQAQDIGATTSLSASQAAEAFKLIASAKPDLLESSTALNEVTRAAVTLAEAAGTSLPDAANTLGSALNQFGAGAEEATRYINVLAAGAKFGAAEVDQVAESLKNAGVSAASAGVSFEETNAAIQALAAVSIKGGEAGTALRNIVLKLETDVDQKLRPSVVGLAGALEELAKRNEDTAALTKRFGLENINAAQALLTNVDSVKELTAQLTGTNTAMEQAATRTNNLDGDIKQLSSAAEALALSLGEKLNPAVRAITQAMTISSTAAANWLDSISDMPTTVDGATLKLAGLYEEMASLRDAAQKLRTDGSGLFGPSGIDIKKAEEYEAQLAVLQTQSAKLSERLLKLKGSGFGGTPDAPAAKPKAPTVAAIPTTSAEGQKALEALKQQAELAKLSGEARARLTAIQKLGASATAEEKAEAERLATEIYRLDEAQKSATKSASEQAKSAEEVKRQQEANADTVAKLREELNQAALSGSELAQRQAELTLNSYATPEQVQQVRDLAAAISDLEAKKKAEQEFTQLSQQFEDPIAKLERERAERLAIIQTYEQLETDSHAQAEAARAEVENRYNQQRMAAMEEMYRQQSWGNELVMDSIDALGAASTNVISGLLSGTMSVKDAMQQFANIILNSVVGAFVDLGVEYIKNQVLASTAQATQLAMAAATGPAIAAAYAPAAAMASLASFGANAAPATAGITSTVAASSALALAGFKDGGFTGNMGTSQVAGVVHGQEYVMNAEATRRIGVGNLERMSSGGSMGGVNITVENNAPGVRVSAEQLTETDVRIIVSEELESQLPGRMTAELADPYSDSRAVLSSNYNIQRNTVR
jgi:TP901 family phage tail tape measure protein